MNTPAPHAMKQPWYRIDVLRRCKTGEVIEATPRMRAEKLGVVALGVLLGVPAIVASQWFFKVWTPRYYAGLDVLAKTDPVASAHQRAEFASLLLLVPVLFGIAAGIVVTIQAMRLVRAGRRPLPGAKVYRRTEVVAGWLCVRVPAILWGVSVLACVFAMWSSYVWLVVFFWNGYLDKQVSLSSKSHLRTMVSKVAPASEFNAIGVKP